MMTTPDRWLSPPQIAKLLGCKADKIIRLIRSGRLPAVDVSSPDSKRPRYRVDADDIKRHLAVRPQAPSPQRTRRNGHKPIEFF